MGRILGVDHGERRIGFALSDPSGIIAMPLKAVTVRSDGEALNAVVDVCGETRAECLVVGLPLSMDGTEGTQAVKVRKFIEQLGPRLSIPIHTWDERLSTSMIQKMLIEADVRRDKRKEVVDKLAAQAILQGYLDSKSMLSDMPES